MIDAVMKGITDAIYGEFGEDYEIHLESSMQGTKEPAFFVRCLTPDIKKQLGERRKMNLLFSVQYFPESKIPKQEINRVFERLYDCLELIEVDNKKCRGTLECQDNSNDVLTVMAEYTLFLNRREVNDHMEEFKMKGGVKDANEIGN